MFYSNIAISFVLPDLLPVQEIVKLASITTNVDTSCYLHEARRDESLRPRSINQDLDDPVAFFSYFTKEVLLIMLFKLYFL